MILATRPGLVAVVIGVAMGVLAVPVEIVRATNPVPWDLPVKEVDAALARGDFRTARQAWQHAYAVALDSEQWEGLVVVGDAAVRIGTAGGDASDVSRARQAYHEAFLRARSEGSVDGVLRVSEAHSRLGEYETARRYRDAAVRLAVRQTSPGFFARVWARLTGHYVR